MAIASAVDSAVSLTEGIGGPCHLWSIPGCPEWLWTFFKDNRRSTVFLDYPPIVIMVMNPCEPFLLMLPHYHTLSQLGTPPSTPQL